MAKKQAKKKRGPRTKERLTPQMLDYVSAQILGFSDRYAALSALVANLPQKEIYANNWSSLQTALSDVSIAVAEAYKGYDTAVKDNVPTANGPHTAQANGTPE